MKETQCLSTSHSQALSPCCPIKISLYCLGIKFIHSASISSAVFSRAGYSPEDSAGHSREQKGRSPARVEISFSGLRLLTLLLNKCVLSVSFWPLGAGDTTPVCSEAGGINLDTEKGLLARSLPSSPVPPAEPIFHPTSFAMNHNHFL